MKLIRIAVDLDGVLADSIRLWIKLWNKRTGQSLTYNEIVEWDFWQKLGLSENEFMRILNEVWRMWKIIPPTEPNIGEKVAKISSLGKIDIVTARPRGTEQYVLKWLEMHKIPYSEYVWVRSGKMKPKLGYEVFIDDSPLIVDKCVFYRRKLLLYDRPWNRGIEENIYVRRIKTLNEAYEVLRSET
ncbi:MAG: hypothetical protein N3F65_04330 [Nitrososphaeria archaeon]|nr:hypothetical protein [Nitrososphaeria archaeon]